MAGRKAGFASKQFEKQFHYGKSDLGAVLTREGTEFRLWAPTAERVELRLYRSGHEGGVFRTEALCRAEKGVWVWKCAEQLNGIYYDYLVTVDRESRETADPYARACGLNGRRRPAQAGRGRHLRASCAGVFLGGERGLSRVRAGNLCGLLL